MGKIKTCILVLLIIGLTGVPAAAQSVTPAERAIAIDTSIATTCAETAPASPRTLSHDANVFSVQRIASALNGVWIGKVSGEYDPQLFASDGFLNVDYYMVVDANRSTAFVYQEFTSRRSGAGLQPQPGASKWSYVWCARDNYETASPRQVHEFVKVSNNVNDARSLISNSTGLTLPAGDVVLSDVWQKLVDAKFFDNPNRSLAYAGVLFNPVTMQTIASSGGSLFELRLVGEYRGSGQTAAKFAPGEPIHNTEQAKFLGLPGSVDFLVATFGLGNFMIGPKRDFNASNLPPLFFDKVVIGPLPKPPGYTTGGGGKFTASGGPVSTLRLDATGTADTGTASSFSDANAINGSLRAFNYSSRTLIESSEFSSLQGTVSGSDLRVVGNAKALVNSVQTNITFELVKIAGVIRFEIRNADTSVVLAGGTGEAGRATFDLTITNQ